MKDMLRASLLALRKNPRRNHLRFYCMVTAKAAGLPGRGVSWLIHHRNGGKGGEEDDGGGESGSFEFGPGHKFQGSVYEG